MKSRNGTPGSHTIVQSGDTIGTIRFSADDGVNYNGQAALIEGEVDGTPGADDMPGRLTFSTSADGSDSPTERLRIHSGGEFSFQTTSKNIQGGGASDFMMTMVANTGSNHNGFGISGVADGHSALTTRPSANHTYFAMYVLNSAASNIGYISGNNNNTTTFSTSSDYRVKENVVSLTGAIPRLKK